MYQSAIMSTRCKNKTATTQLSFFGNEYKVELGHTTYGKTPYIIVENKESYVMYWFHINSQCDEQDILETVKKIIDNVNIGVYTIRASMKEVETATQHKVTKSISMAGKE